MLCLCTTTHDRDRADERQERVNPDVEFTYYGDEQQRAFMNHGVHPRVTVRLTLRRRRRLAEL